MPNTLAHLGVQTIATKAVDHTIDVKWIAVGCIIPDIPWIMQRIVHWLAPGIDSISLRAYTMVQASLFFCLLLSGALCLLARKKKTLFFVLSSNSLLHLLLDSLQIKWANGVHLLAPFSWHLTSLGFFWPEHWITKVLSLLGCIVLLVFAVLDRHQELDFAIKPLNTLFASLLLLLYLAAPPLFMDGPFANNNHFIQTLRDQEKRPGKAVAIDRGRYDPQTSTLQIFTGEKLLVDKIPLTKKTKISLKGTFQDCNTVTVSAYHVHSSQRDRYSFVGLFAVLTIWLLAIFLKKSKVAPRKGTLKN
jgi:hypothetical protein